MFPVLVHQPPSQRTAYVFPPLQALFKPSYMRWCNSRFKEVKMPGVGDPAPDFSGHDFINDAPFALHDHAGQVIVVSFVYHG